MSISFWLCCYFVTELAASCACAASHRLGICFRGDLKIAGGLLCGSQISRPSRLTASPYTAATTRTTFTLSCAFLRNKHRTGGWPPCSRPIATRPDWVRNERSAVPRQEKESRRALGYTGVNVHIAAPALCWFQASQLVSCMTITRFKACRNCSKVDNPFKQNRVIRLSAIVSRQFGIWGNSHSVLKHSETFWNLLKLAFQIMCQNPCARIHVPCFVPEPFHHIFQSLVEGAEPVNVHWDCVKL